QIISIEEYILSFKSNQDSKDLEILQDKLLILQEEIDEFQEFVPNTTNNFTNLQGNISNLEYQIENLNNKIISLQNSPNIVNQNITYLLYENISLSSLFENVRKSVVVVEGIIPQYDRFGRIYYSQVQGSGFVYNVEEKMVILTNYHVINNAININITFTTGNSYSASVLGTDQYSDLAVLTTEASLLEYFPLITVSSSSLSVGDPVVVVGTPYGLSGSMSEGIVSALNRTLTIDDFSISNVIQTTAPINPGNSGGPLLNYQGEVVGIVTAIIQDSQGIGFAIPSDTIVEKIANIIL
ncbi:MAG: trypsin-like peptidase domain-containing protein, partial [Melioribacteraceae bacterium]|nr:trypsin-like peptidase domain-containing protein [Melioribacteraceae bacterium]